MRVADVVEIEKGGKIGVDTRLASLLGFEKGAQVFLSLVGSKYYRKGEGDNIRRNIEYQMFVTSLDPKIFDQVFEIEFTLGDEPGSLATVAELLEDQGVKMEIGESRTILYDVRAEASVTAQFENEQVDVTKLNRTFRDRIKAEPALRNKIKPIRYEMRLEVDDLRSLATVEKAISEHIIFDNRLAWERSGRLMTTRFKRFDRGIHLLSDLKKTLAHEIERRTKAKARLRSIEEVWVLGRKPHLPEQKKTINYPVGTGKVSGTDVPVLIPTEQRHQRMEERDGRVYFALPKYVVDKIDGHFRGQSLLDSGESLSQGMGTALLVADTTIRVLRMTFPPPKARIIRVVFQMKDAKGAIGTCANFLSQQEVNLLETQINNKVLLERTEWSIIGNVRHDAYMHLSKKELQDHLLRDMGSHRDTYDVEITTCEIFGERDAPQAAARGIEVRLIEYVTIKMGEDEKARELLHKYLGQMTGDAIGILTYIDETTLRYLDRIPRSSGIRIITSAIKKERDFSRAMKIFAKGRPHFELRMYTYWDNNEKKHKPLFHERWLKSADLCIDPGTDLKDSSIARRIHDMKIFGATGFQAREPEFEHYWKATERELGITLNLDVKIEDYLPDSKV